jgi:riboflavin kinase / FMN adenylyltransferase
MFCTKIFARIVPYSFIKDIIVKYLKPQYIVLGENSHFGANKAGDLKLLRTLAKEFGFNVKTINLRKDNGIVSSPRIRPLLQTGDIKAASKLLGYEIK